MSDRPGICLYMDLCNYFTHKRFKKSKFKTFILQVGRQRPLFFVVLHHQCCIDFNETSTRSKSWVTVSKLYFSTTCQIFALWYWLIIPFNSIIRIADDRIDNNMTVLLGWYFQNHNLNKVSLSLSSIPFPLIAYLFISPGMYLYS